MLVTKTLLAVLGLAVVGVAWATDAPQDTWPVPVMPGPDGAPPLSAEESMETIVVPPGYSARSSPTS